MKDGKGGYRVFACNGNANACMRAPETDRAIETLGTIKSGSVRENFATYKKGSGSKARAAPAENYGTYKKGP